MLAIEDITSATGWRGDQYITMGHASPTCHREEGCSVHHHGACHTGWRGDQYIAMGHASPACHREEGWSVHHHGACQSCLPQWGGVISKSPLGMPVLPATGRRGDQNITMWPAYPACYRKEGWLDHHREACQCLPQGGGVIRTSPGDLAWYMEEGWSEQESLDWSSYEVCGTTSPLKEKV